jgi:hypothetical protein
MRAAIILATILWASAALAQTATPPATTEKPSTATEPRALPGVSRDDYIAKYREAAAKRAAARFDAMDANHDGVLTKEEIATYRAAHPRKKAGDSDEE